MAKSSKPCHLCTYWDSFFKQSDGSMSIGSCEKLQMSKSGDSTCNFFKSAMEFLSDIEFSEEKIQNIADFWE